MDKREYMEKLYYEIGNMSAEQKEEIMAIFNEHFEQGAIDGKSDEEICRDLGSPAYVAAQFIENNREVLQNAKTTSQQEMPQTIPAENGALPRQNRPGEKNEVEKRPSYDDRSYTGDVNIGKCFNPDGINKICVNMMAADIKIFSDTGSKVQNDDIKVMINGWSKNSRFDVNVSGGVLNIIESRKFVLINLFNFIRSVRVEIYVPQSYTGTLYLKNSAGNVNLHSLNLRSAELRAMAGDIRVDSHTGDFEIHSTAGNIILNNVCGKMNTRSSAGDVKIEDCDGDIEARSTAGNVKILNNNGRIFASTSAGNLNVKANEIFGMSASSSAGNVKVEAKKISGDVELSSSAGSVTLETREVAGSITAKSSLGNVNVLLPRDTSMRISSRGSGKVRSELKNNPDSPYVLDVSTSLGTANIKCFG